MNSEHQLSLVDLDALTRELLLTPPPTPPIPHSENAQHPFAARNAGESQRASKRSRKRTATPQSVKAALPLPQATQPNEVSRLLLSSVSSVEVTELLAALNDAFDSVIGGLVLSKDSSIKGMLIYRMKRKLVLRAAERFIQTSVFATIDDVADEVLNEANRLHCIPN